MPLSNFAAGLSKLGENIMDSATASVLQWQLTDRRERLATAIQQAPKAEHLMSLLKQVDSALERMTHGAYGLCKVCHDPIEADRLILDPLLEACLDHLTSIEKEALERDLSMAARIQNKLLPKRDINVPGWDVTFHYEPAGTVSGDYCDLVTPSGHNGDLYFLLGDVTGKGIATSMLMAHLQAIFHSLIGIEPSVTRLVEQANRIFCQSTLPTHFATLICGKAEISGELQLCNAGHCQPIVIRSSGTTTIEESNLALGLVCEGRYNSTKVRLNHGDSLFLYTDGLTETVRGQDEQYGVERLSRLLAEVGSRSAKQIVHDCIKDLKSFRADTPVFDDLTIMVIKRN